MQANACPLKHPLNLISASAELIGRTPEARANPSIGRAAGTIRRTVVGQAQIIDDLLDMSRLRTGKLSIARAPVDLGEVVSRICHAVEEDAARKKIALQSTVPDQPVRIEADVTRIEQIVWNLVSHALKFTGEGDRIELTLRTSGNSATFSVADTGAGIDNALLPHIFNMLHQGPARQGGLGIGLSLVKELVAVQGGTVRAESEGIGKGATFSVTFPLHLEREASSEPASQNPLPLAGVTALVVDDDYGTADTFRMLLEFEGAVVTVATSGAEALKKMESQIPALVLSDIGMPGMSGLELVAAIRRDQRLSGVAAIAMSGYGRADDIRQSLDAGFDAHLAKPVSLDALLESIGKLGLKSMQA